MISNKSKEFSCKFRQNISHDISPYCAGGKLISFLLFSFVVPWSPVTVVDVITQSSQNANSQYWVNLVFSGDDVIVGRFKGSTRFQPRSSYFPSVTRLHIQNSWIISRKSLIFSFTKSYVMGIFSCPSKSSKNNVWKSEDRVDKKRK